LALAAPCLSAARSEKPNVVFILADDLGYNGLHCYGNEWLETPNIDKLASQGMKFTNGLAAYPTCLPSRMAIITGQYGPRTGGYRVCDRHKGLEDYIKYIVPKNRKIAPEKITIGECFQNAGYSTAFYGKWHVGDNKAGHPSHHGFDVAISATGHYELRNPAPPVKLPKGMYAAKFFTLKAKDFIEKAKEEGKPFFLFMSYYLVHAPFEAEKDYIEHFKKKLRNVPLKDKHPDRTIIVAAMTKMLDDCVGQLMDELKSAGLEKNTIVVFTSDNGSYSIDYTGPVRGQKGDTYEGGLRVPYIFKWPGHIPSGTDNGERVMGIDIYPTLAALAGIQKPKDYILDGEDISPILLGDKKKLPHRKLYCYYPKYAQYRKNTKHWIFSWRNVIYDGDYKLIEYPEYGEYELFNLADDPKEKKNLAEENPEKRSALIQELHQWLKELGTKLAPNPNYKLK